MITGFGPMYDKVGCGIWPYLGPARCVWSLGTEGPIVCNKKV